MLEGGDADEFGVVDAESKVVGAPDAVIEDGEVGFVACLDEGGEVPDFCRCASCRRFEYVGVRMGVHDLYLEECV